MHYLIFIACLSTVFAQYQLLSLGSLLKYANNSTAPEINYCATNTSGCPSICLNGTYPPYGYTCQTPENSQLEIDAGTQMLFEFAKNASKQYLSQQIINIQSITVDLVNGYVSYTFGLSGALSQIDVQFILPIIPSAISSSISQSTPYSVNQNRIDVTSPSPYTVVIFTFYLPKAVIVTWTSIVDGSISNLRNLVFNITNLNISAPRDQLLEANGCFENNDTVWVTFVEDISCAQGADPNLKPRACDFTKDLFNSTYQSLVVSQCGYNITLSTIKTTDPTCSFIPPQPAPAPARNEVGERVVTLFWLGTVFVLLKNVNVW